MLKNVFGVKLRLVTGYPGTAEIALALERGEVDGRASWSWSSLKSLKPEWIASNKVHLPVQLNLAKSPDLPDVPLIADYRHERAATANPETRAEPADHGPAVHGTARNSAPTGRRRCARHSTTP